MRFVLELYNELPVTYNAPVLLQLVGTDLKDVNPMKLEIWVASFPPKLIAIGPASTVDCAVRVFVLAPKVTGAWPRKKSRPSVVRFLLLRDGDCLGRI